MNIYEKLFTITAIFFLTGITVIFLIFPETRIFSILIPLATAGVIINAGLLFIVFKDIFTRSFSTQTQKFSWAALVFIFFPIILIYLPLHGFKKRNN